MASSDEIISLGDFMMSDAPEQPKEVVSLNEFMGNAPDSEFTPVEETNKRGFVDGLAANLHAGFGLGATNFQELVATATGISNIPGVKDYFAKYRQEYTNEAESTRSDNVGIQIANDLTRTLGDMGASLPIDVVAGGVTKAALVGKVIPSVDMALSILPDFAVGSGWRGLIEGINKGDAIDATTGALENVALGGVYGQVGGGIKGILKMASLGSAMTFYEGLKEGRLPTSAEFAKSATDGAALGVVFSILPHIAESSKVRGEKKALKEYHKQIGESIASGNYEKAQDNLYIMLADPKIRIEVKEAFRNAVDSMNVKEGMPKDVSTYELLADQPTSETSLSRAKQDPSIGSQEIPQSQTSEIGITEASASSPLNTSIAQNKPKASLDVIDKLIKALGEAEPVRKEQEELYRKERGRRMAIATSMADKVGGEGGFHAKLGAFKGQMPKADYMSVRSKFAQSEIDSLFQMLHETTEITNWDKLSAGNGLMKVFGEEGGKVPTEGELALLTRVYGSEFVEAILDKRSAIQKANYAVGQLLNIPRSIMASIDLSAPLRQGMFLIGRPKQFIPAFMDMFKYFGSEKALIELQKNIESRPTYELMRDHGLALTDTGIGMNLREERFMSNWAENIPVLGVGIKASGRAYTGFLNKLRADVFDDIVKTAQLSGNLNGRVLDSASRFVNAATGRGQLGGNLAQAAVALNGVLFSPRLIMSRMNLLNPAFYINLDPVVRKEALKSLVSFAGTALTIATLARLGGAEISGDARSADFMKVKIGDTRIDVLGGFQQYIKLGFQLITGQIVSSTTGTTMTLGEGYKPMTRQDIILRFFESKESPIASFIGGLMKGRDALGNKFDVPKEVAQRFVPMMFQDLYDLVKEKGPGGAAFIVPGIFGAGVQTYTRDVKDTVRAYRSVKTNAAKLRKEGDVEGAKKLQDRNTVVMKQGRKLESAQKSITEIEKKIDVVKKNKKLTQEQKNTKIKTLQERLKIKTEKAEQKLKVLKSGGI